MMRFPLLALSSILVLAAAVGPAVANERAIVVLDGSGSMWGQIDGRPKLEIAREALADVLAGAPSDLELGLMAYGHRQRGVCSDIELVVEPGPGTSAAIADAAARMRFLGKTPLSDAVRQAAEALRHTEERATVILITDGIETCDADPCAVGRALEESGIDFTAHVVGFGLSQEEGRAVACLASETGGRYIAAGDADGLRAALGEAVAAAAVAPEPAAAQPVVLPPASLDAPSEAAIGSDVSVAYEGPAAEGDYIDIVPEGYEETFGEASYAWVADGVPAVMRAPGEPGAYTIRYVWEGPEGRRVLAEAPLAVVEAEVALIAPSEVGAGTSVTVEWRGPGGPSDYVDIVPAGYAETGGEISYAYLADGNPVAIRAPAAPGTYALRYVLEGPDGRRVLTEVGLDVIEARASLAVEPIHGVGDDIPLSWTGPNGAGDYIDLVPAGYADTSGEISYRYTGDSPDGETVILRAPGEAGAYEVRYILEAPDGRSVLARTPITIEERPATLTLRERLAAGQTFTVAFEAPGSSDSYIDLVPRGYAETSGELAYAYTMDGGDEATILLEAPAEPGAYDVRYVLEASGGRRVLTRVPISVEATEALVPVTFVLPETFTLPVSWSAIPMHPTDRPEAVAPPDPAVRADVELEPGVWEVTAEAPGEIRFRALVTVAPGMPSTVLVPEIGGGDGGPPTTVDAAAEPLDAAGIDAIRRTLQTR